jgi:hypothetical protein
MLRCVRCASEIVSNEAVSDGTTTSRTGSRRSGVGDLDDDEDEQVL